MIVNAIKEQITGATVVVVDRNTVRFSIPEKGLRFVYPTPPLAKDALARFDAGITVDPFIVRLINGRATSMARHVKETDATGAVKTRKKLRHNLGAQTMRVTKTSSGAIETEIVGGQVTPVQKPKDPSHSSIRTFGERRWTQGWVHESELQASPPAKPTLP